MTYPNAAKGVKKLFNAEILYLISALLLGASAVTVAAVSGMSGSENDAAFGVLSLVSLLLILGTLVVLLIAGIINIVGYVQASKDEKGFGKALLCTVASLVLSFSSTMLLKETGLLGWLSTGLSVGSELLRLLSFAFAVFALMRLSEACGRTDMVERGRTILRILIAVNFLSLLVLVINEMLLSNLFNASLALVCSVLSALLAVVQIVLFIRYLAKAAKMLREN